MAGESRSPPSSSPPRTRQTTEYVYGTTLSDSDIARSDLLRAVSSARIASRRIDEIDISAHDNVTAAQGCAMGTYVEVGG